MKIIVDVNLAVRWAEMLSDKVVEALMRYSGAIEQGTIITIDPNKTRLHILPFAPPEN
jgi:predicted nuclease of predicted toxin-antitoxin system